MQAEVGIVPFREGECFHAFKCGFALLRDTRMHTGDGNAMPLLSINNGRIDGGYGAAHNAVRLQINRSWHREVLHVFLVDMQCASMQTSCGFVGLGRRSVASLSEQHGVVGPLVSQNRVGRLQARVAQLRMKQ